VWPQFPYPDAPNRFWELIGGLQHYRGNYQADPHTSPFDGFLPDIIDRGFGAPDYVVGDIVQIDPRSDFASEATIPGAYICIKDQPSPAQFPVHPLVPTGTPFDYFGRDYWRLLSTWPSKRQMCDDSGAVVTVYADIQPTQPPFT
jgi:hypothetical protein